MSILRQGIYAQKKASGVTTLIPGDGTTIWTTAGAVTTSVGQILPTTTAIAWGKTGSYGSIPTATDGYVEFTPKYMSGKSSGGYMMTGFSSTLTGGFATGEHMIYIDNGINVAIYESGTPRGNKTTITIGDTFRVERVGSTVYYKKNGTTFYTSGVASSGVIYSNTDINRYLGAENCKIEY